MNNSKFLILLLFVSILLSCNKSTTEEYTVMKGHFRQSITETGELEAVSAEAITMPRLGWQYGYEFKIVSMAQMGELVTKGDTIIRIDPSSVQKFIITQEEALENETAAAAKQKIQMENNIQDLNAQLKSEQAQYDLIKLEVDRVKFESANKRKIKELEFKQATIRMEKIKRQMEVKPKLDNYDFKTQQIKVQQREVELSTARAALNKMSILCPKDGLFQIAKSDFYYPPKDIKVGDALYGGMLIARIPDISHMKIRTTVSEADFRKVSVGMKVIVRLDALPSVPFTGTITSISKICLTRDKDKVFNVLVNVNESDIRLKPGMTVSCEYICKEVDDELYVPNKCLLKENGRCYVFLKKGKNPKKVEVRIGASNSNHTLVSGDIKAGQKLVPFENITNEKKS